MNYKPKKYVLIQARTNSSRLFGKCIFYIKKKELIVLLHNRIKSKDYETVILTSRNKSDDYLTNILKKNKIKFFRGDLENVRNRFLKFTSNLNNKDIIVRCTADNLFVDKNIINLLLDKFEKSKKKYLTIDRKKSKLPYGISAEIFSVGTLRKMKTKSKKDLEHVTPPLIRLKSKTEKIIIQNKINLYNKSCTLDTLYDYFKIKYIFENFNNSITTNWYKLCTDLKKINKKNIEKKIEKKFSKIIIGTAQFGFKYGINNQNNNIKQSDVNSILTFAKKNYINILDTAENYKHSEKRIGKYLEKNLNSFHIISKFNHNRLYKINFSLKKLKLNKLQTLLIHNPSELKSEADVLKVKKDLKKYKSKLEKVGVSINFPSELSFLQKFKFFKIFQIPYNILDKRWEKFFKYKKSHIKFYVRSIFLQGLLITPKKNWPSNFKKKFNLIKKSLVYLKNKLNRFDEKDLLFNYVYGNKKISKIIIGIEKREQIEQIPFYLLRKDLTILEKKLINNKIPKLSNNFLTPLRWKNENNN